MKRTIYFWLAMIWAILPLRAGAQNPESLPTLPALPVFIETPPSLPSIQVVPNYGPAMYPPSDPLRRSFRPGQQVTIAGPASPAEIAAAMIKADEANVERQRSVIRYLGGVDCTYYPQAESALIAALRSDPHESLRYEAAQALSNSSCWTRNTLVVLNQAMTGSSADGFPSERLRPRPWGRSAACRALCGGKPSGADEGAFGSVAAILHSPRFRRGVAIKLCNGRLFSVGASERGQADRISAARAGPIGVVPDEWLPLPTYEPTPLQQPSKR